jgi:hypothetical protein
MPNKKNEKAKGKQSRVDVVADDFDHMLAEFAAEDVEVASRNTTGATIAVSTTTAMSTTVAASATSSGSLPSEEDVLDACLRRDINQLHRWGSRGVRVVSAGPLAQAVGHDWLDIMRCLVKELGADVNQMSVALATRIHQEHVDAMVCLVKELGADINLAGSDGYTPLSLATHPGHLELVRRMVKELGADVNLAGPPGRTPFLIAASREHLALVRCLVKDLGADVNQQTYPEGRTALMIAVHEDNLELVRLLVKELGADVNLPMKDGHTPLMAAAGFKHEKITKLLLKAGADAQTTILIEGEYYTAASSAALIGVPARLADYLEAKTHCSNSGCAGAGIRKCTGCKQARYCGQTCQLAHWLAHKAECKAQQAKSDAID